MRMNLFFALAAGLTGCYGHTKEVVTMSLAGERTVAYERSASGIGVGLDGASPIELANANATNTFADVNGKCQGEACKRGILPYGYGGAGLPVLPAGSAIGGGYGYTASGQLRAEEVWRGLAAPVDVTGGASAGTSDGSLPPPPVLDDLSLPPPPDPDPGAVDSTAPSCREVAAEKGGQVTILLEQAESENRKVHALLLRAEKAMNQAIEACKGEARTLEALRARRDGIVASRRRLEAAR